ncbi:PREDICTED: uncharacterized protein At5g08430 [Tarenaya hassleriana]|uniref:uncharacterized protein At5g08430 n=1 Tax=Tarenaya hassleriana TaxID=28532 RepID=UPI00053C1AB8|nr:PREDICTED: uncharacterized protein At5g08430 [Tarenaya hassleriana]
MPTETVEEECEDWCFVCKDGGDLIICEYPKCTKVYHRDDDCIAKGKSVTESGDGFICNWHSCYLCGKASKLRCFCCPHALCRGCVAISEFSCIKGDKGLCNECMGEVLTLEEIREYAPAGIDLKDPDTFECLFLEYWDIIKGREGLTVEDVRSANPRKKRGKRKYKEDPKFSPSDSENEDAEDYRPTHKKKRMNFSRRGTKPLVDFLKSIGKDTGEKLEHSDVVSIIRGYIFDKNLLDDKKKKVHCDEKLHPIFRRKSVRMKSIHNLLKTRFEENFELLEDDIICLEEDCSSEKRENVLVPCKKHEKSDEKASEKEAKTEVRSSGLASINADNIKLVYLRKSLVEELSKKNESFEEKVVGSFVKVKNDPRECIHRNYYQLLPVTGLKRNSTADDPSRGVLLHVSGVSSHVCISKLDDSDITEEDIEDLKQKVMNGHLRQPTVLEMEEKAKVLHEDVTRHWIARQLVILRNCINHANEKGWRAELLEYLEQRDLLEKPAEQERLIRQTPRIIEDVVEVKRSSSSSSGGASRQCVSSSSLTEEVIDVD